jgi:exosortase/archaeosortase family protein
MATTIPAGRLTGRDDTATTAVSVGLAVVAIAVLALQEIVRRSEASFSAGLLRVLHVRPAHSTGISVVFPLKGHFVGYTLSVGCSAALLIIPFMLVSAGLLGSRRVTTSRCLQSLAVVAVILFLVNQLRFLVIAASMVVWGYRIGYERSHIFFGTLLSTVGVVAGVIVFIYMLGGDRRETPAVKGADDEF